VVVTQVHDGTQALARAAREDYDLVIMDIHLPGMDGKETARRIRTLRPCYQTVPIIALTADVFFDAPENLANSGIDACLLKPLDEDKLWRLMNTLRSTRAGTCLKGGASANLARHEPGTAPPGLTKEIGLPSYPPSRDLTKVLPALADSLEELARRLDEAVRGNDPADLRSIIHELKGVVCYFGITDLSHAVLEAERLLNSRAVPGDIAIPLQTVRKQITDFVASHGERLHEINHSE
jgi:CheY-like chemotaxis protein